MTVPKYWLNPENLRKMFTYKNILYVTEGMVLFLEQMEINNRKPSRLQ